MTLLSHHIRYDLLAFARRPRTQIFGLVFPLILLVVLVGSASGHTTVNGDTISISRFFVGGIVTMSLMASAYATTTMNVVMRRQSGILKRRRATPTPAWVVVASQAVAVLVLAVAAIAILLIVATLGYGVGVTATGLAGIALAVVLGTLVFTCLGFAVASLVPTADAAQPIVQLTMLPLYFISGIWFTTDDMPAFLRHLGEAFPVQPVADLLHRAFLDPGVPLHDVAVLGIWAVGGLFIAARRFSWLPR